MASVFLAQQESTGRLVAIKTMALHLQSDPRWAKRFLDEARRLAELSHPNIVPVFDWGMHDDVGYMVMEYLKGGDLSYRLKHVRITVRDTLEIVRQVASGLDFAAEKGYVHRDIKPGNILFREDGSPCILDFGIAKDSSADTTYSGRGLPIGTGAYMSPEQAQPGAGQIDGRSDLYSLGIVLYEMLVGVRPFEFQQYDSMQAFHMHLFAHVHTSPPALPEQLSVFQPLMDKLLAKDPARRVNRGNDVRYALTAIENTLSSQLLDRPIRDVLEQSDTVIQRSFAGSLAPSYNSSPRIQVDPGERTVPTFVASPRAGHSKKLVVLAAGAALSAAAVFFGYDLIKGEMLQLDASLFDPLFVDAPVKKAPQDPELQAMLEDITFLASASPANLLEKNRLLHTYRAILARDPQQPVAMQGMQQLLQQQVELVVNWLGQGDLENVADHLAFIDQISAGSAGLLEARYRKALTEQAAGNELRELKQLEWEITSSIEQAKDASVNSRIMLIKAARLMNVAVGKGMSPSQLALHTDRLAAVYADLIEAELNRNNLRFSRALLIDMSETPLLKTAMATLSVRIEAAETSLANQQIQAKDEIPGIDGGRE